MKICISLISLLILMSCGHIRSDGGQASFDAATYSTLQPTDHATYAQTVIKREERDPEGITLKELVASPQGQLKKMAIILFETQFQSTRTGLAVGRNVYMNERGKQILAEKAYSFWSKALAQTASVTWLKRSELEKSPAFRSYGSPVNDYVLSKNLKMSDNDIFWKSGGQEVPMTSLILPRNQQDVSVLYIPATEMMITTKMVEQQKHWVNDICKELGLDGVILVSSAASWNAGGVDKRTKEVIPEEAKVNIEASILYPFKAYQAAGAAKGKMNLPQKNISLAVYSVASKLPVKITIPEEEQTFEAINKNLLEPVWSSYEALSALMIDRMITDIQQTHR